MFVESLIVKPLHMNNSKVLGQLEVKSDGKSLRSSASYRGFRSIDQEIEREIALQWFSVSGKSSFAKKNTLAKTQKA